jgi:hypothetical protein
MRSLTTKCPRTVSKSAEAEYNNFSIFSRPNPTWEFVCLCCGHRMPLRILITWSMWWK